MIAARFCSKPGCTRSAVATLTYDYQGSTAVLGPLATSAEPHTYDLCEEHAASLTAPRGWQIVRLVTTFEPAPPSPDDLLALVDAVRRAARVPSGEVPDSRHSVHTPAAEAASSTSHVQYGPFRSSPTARPPETDRGIEEREARPAGSKGASGSPLDPNSEWAKRRAMFRVVSAEDHAAHSEDSSAP